MEINGQVHLIGETQTVGNNGFTKRQIVVKTEEQYPQLIGIDFVKDKCTILDKYKVGQNVKVSINIRGNEYNGKYYINLQGWRIENVEGANTPAPSASSTPQTIVEEEAEDLPF